MRSNTPVLGTVNRASIANEERNESAERARSTTPNASSSAYISRPSSASRRSANMNTNSNTHRVVGLGANLAVGTVLRGGSLTALHERPGRGSALTAAHQPRSAKQGPGQRKVRRWNNDKFIGIASDISNTLASKNPQRGIKIANIYAEAEMEKGKYTMPNAPRGNRTIFSTLLSDNRTRGAGIGLSDDEGYDDGYGSDSGKVKIDPSRVAEIRGRFIDGEVGVENTEMTEAGKERMRKREEELYKDGHRMMKKVNPRLLNVVIRACKGSGFTRNVVDAFENLISSMPKNGSSASSTTAIQKDIWKKVLIQKPLVTRKSRAGGNGSNLTIRMLFCDDESKGAFNRLLLHAVCQFHGLDTASSTTSKGHRMMTVTGLCKGEKFRFLDFVPFDGTVSLAVTSKNLSLDKMAALTVS
jgi:hypothetical protein